MRVIKLFNVENWFFLWEINAFGWKIEYPAWRYIVSLRILG